MSVWAWIGVAALGGVGAISRASLDVVIGNALSGRLPGRGSGLIVGTFVVNISGALLLGLVDGLALTGDASTLVGTATLGAYTTFSTWMLQTQQLRVERLYRMAAFNIAGSVLIGFAAVLLGRAIGTVL